MKSRFSLKFYLRPIKEKANVGKIFLRIIVNRKKSELYTMYKVPVLDWDEVTQRCKTNFINKALITMENEAYSLVERLERENKQVTSVHLKSLLRNEDKLDKTLLEYFEQQIQRMLQSKEIKHDSIRRYIDTKVHLVNFVQIKKQMIDVPLANIDYSFINDFDFYLTTYIIKNTNNRLERNTINKHHSRLRTILIKAKKEGLLSISPYENFKLKDTPTKREFLSQEELDAIMSLDLSFNKSLDKVRDLFLFSVFTGLRFNDAQSVMMDDIHFDAKGNINVLRIMQAKTSEPVFIPVLSEAQTIIDKYEGPERLVTNKILPSISNQKLNAYLKVISDLANIKRMLLTHHVARHTCATTVLLDRDVPIELVSKWLGHTDIKTTKIYAKIGTRHLVNIAKKINNSDYGK